MEVSLIWIFIGVGGFVGGLVPSIFGASYISVWGILGSLLGSITGIIIFRRMDLD